MLSQRRTSVLPKRSNRRACMGGPVALSWDVGHMVGQISPVTSGQRINRDVRPITASGGPMTSTLSLQHARGSFTVEVKPQTPDNPAAETSGVSRLSLQKQFQGDLEGTGQGEMLGAGDGKTSGGYVAMEKISGTLGGRKGSFV